MYMPGRSRTGSRPSRTVMSFAEYVVSAIKKALLNLPMRARGSVSPGAAGGGSCQAVRGRSRDELAELRILDRRGRAGRLRTLLRRGCGWRWGRAHRVRRGGFRQRPGREAERMRSSGPEGLSETAEDRLAQLRQLECPGRRARVDVQRAVAGGAGGERV